MVNPANGGISLRDGQNFEQLTHMLRRGEAQAFVVNVPAPAPGWLA